MDLLNHTPFAADRFLFVLQGLETLLVVVKATFELAPSPAVAERQEPVVPADEHAGDPATTAIQNASDAAPFKPAAEVLLRGHAYTAPGKRSEVMVAFQLGTLRKTARVVGDRVYQGTLGASEPAPFEKLPLTWERAFGGTDASNPAAVERCQENPVGRGFRASHSKLPSRGAPLPNLEAPGEPILKPGAAGRALGFGPIGPSWSPRVQYAGTYDDQWRASVCPDLPADFDPRFHQAAPPDQVLPGYLQGGEPGALIGASPRGPVRFTVPSVRPRLEVRIGGQTESPPLLCDTAIIDGDLPALILVWRAHLVVQGRVPDVRSLRIRADVQ